MSSDSVRLVGVGVFERPNGREINRRRHYNDKLHYLTGLPNEETIFKTLRSHRLGFKGHKGHKGHLHGEIVLEKYPVVAEYSHIVGALQENKRSGGCGL